MIVCVGFFILSVRVSVCVCVYVYVWMYVRVSEWYGVCLLVLVNLCMFGVCVLVHMYVCECMCA